MSGASTLSPDDTRANGGVVRRATSVPSLRVLIAIATAMSAFCLTSGFLPWNREGTPWRPADPAREAAARAHWDEELIARGREFRSKGYSLFFLREGMQGALLVAAVALGAHRMWRRLPLAGTIGAPALALVAGSVLIDVVSMPFGLVSLAHRRAYGLSTQSLALWFLDFAKGIGISVVLTFVAGLILFWLVSRFPRWWPLLATLAAGVCGVIVAWLVPLAIAPLFNTFTPLSDAALRDRFLDLARRGGVPAKEVLVTDASRRTLTVNAYFSGFGPSRRIVVYDTLVETLTPEQAGLVMAHEVGHWHHAHIAKGVLLGTLAAGFAFALAKIVFGGVLAAGGSGAAGASGAAAGADADRSIAWGLGARDPAIAPIVLLLAWALFLIAMPVENAISRAFEAQADEFAIELSDDPATHIEVEETLARKNLADVVPPPMIEALLFTHPPVLDRIALGEARLPARPPAS
jgi:Zn-dependent protease with chaperone function